MTQPVRRIAGVLPLLAAATLLAGAATGVTSARASAGAPASVRVQPLASRVDWSDGPFSIRIELSDLDHHGTITYDDNRDTVPDREEQSDGLAAFEIDLRFDPAVLRVTEVEAGDFISSAGRATQCFQRTPEPGEFALGCVSGGSAPGAQGSGTLATITLLPVANGTSFLGLETALAGPLGDTIPATADGGIVEVFGGPDVTPTPEPDGPTGGEGDAPTVIGGGELGDVPWPEGDPGPGALSDGGGTQDGAGADGPDAQALPSTGAGHQPRGATPRPLVLGGALAVAAAALLLLAWRLAAQPRRP